MCEFLVLIYNGLFECHRKLHGLFKAKVILVAERLRELILFPKGISPKVIVIARLEFELVDYDVAV